MLHVCTETDGFAPNIKPRFFLTGGGVRWVIRPRYDISFLLGGMIVVLKASVQPMARASFG